MRAKVALFLAAVAVMLPAGGAHAAAPNVIDGPTGRTVLTGGWTARLDPSNTGLQAGWPRGDFTGAAISLPYVFRAPQVTGAAGIAAFQGSVGWYRRRLYIPADGRYAIRFESLNFRGDVWLDGRHLVTHLGTYLPFEARARLKQGPHTLVVRADWRDPAAMKAAGYHRTWFNFGG